MTRLTATISGHVQGVGFRFTTQRIARSFAVTGYVKNLANGKVLIIAEGEKEDTDAFLSVVHERMAERIRNIDLQHTDATEEFREEAFGIRR